MSSSGGGRCWAFAVFFGRLADWRTLVLALAEAEGSLPVGLAGAAVLYGGGCVGEGTEARLAVTDEGAEFRPVL